MCPLRVILIFLSATIAGFFLIRGLNAEPDQFDADADADDKAACDSGSPSAPLPLHSKITSPSSPPSILSFLPALTGWVGFENRVLDYGGHGKWTVPLAHACCTTGKI